MVVVKKYYVPNLSNTKYYVGDLVFKQSVAINCATATETCLLNEGKTSSLLRRVVGATSAPSLPFDSYAFYVLITGPTVIQSSRTGSYAGKDYWQVSSCLYCRLLVRIIAFSWALIPFITLIRTLTCPIQVP
jgi:hypothetical protein